MVWTHLQPQISEHIQYMRSLGHTFGEMQQALMDRHNWTLAPIFKQAEFNYEQARFTLTQLCNMVELITGSDMEFAEDLRKNISGQVEFEWEVYRRERQEDLRRELGYAAI